MPEGCMGMLVRLICAAAYTILAVAMLGVGVMLFAMLISCVT